MAANTNVLRGVIHGKTIELDNETGLPDGQRVKITVQPVFGDEKLIGRLAPGEGIRRSAGAWADGAEELDKYLAWNRQQRKASRPPIED